MARPKTFPSVPLKQLLAEQMLFSWPITMLARAGCLLARKQTDLLWAYLCPDQPSQYKQCKSDATQEKYGRT